MNNIVVDLHNGKLAVIDLDDRKIREVDNQINIKSILKNENKLKELDNMIENIHKKLEK